MYLAQYTKNAHAGRVPQHCWIDGSRHRLLKCALRAADKQRVPTGQPHTWANNTRVINEVTGERPPSEAIFAAWEEMYADDE